MQEFRISEAQFKKYQRRLLTYYIPFLVLVIAGVTVYNSYSTSTKGGDFAVWPILLPIFVLYFGFMVYRTIRRQRRLLMSYRIIIDDREITREQDKTPTISISFMEIKEIIKTRKGAFLVKGLNRTDVIGIPKWLNETGELEQHLQNLGPITTDKKDPLMLRYRSALMLVGLGLYICVFSVHNKVIVAVSAILLAGLLGRSFYEIQTSKNVTTYTKRSSWFYLLIIASLLYITYIKLTLPEL